MPKAKKQEAVAMPEISPTITKKIEEKQVQEHVAIGAHVVHETIRREGEDELKTDDFGAGVVGAGGRDSRWDFRLWRRR